MNRFEPATVAPEGTAHDPDPATWPASSGSRPTPFVPGPVVPGPCPRPPERRRNSVGSAFERGDARELRQPSRADAVRGARRFPPADSSLGYAATETVSEGTIIEAQSLAASVAKLADEKKAEDIRVIAVAKQLNVADYFVLLTGQNRNHVRAIYNELHVRLKAAGERHRPVEGADLGWWIVMDFGDVVVHIFQDEARSFYDIERLYGDCDELEWERVETPEFAPIDA